MMNREEETVRRQEEKAWRSIEKYEEKKWWNCEEKKEMREWVGVIL